MTIGVVTFFIVRNLVAPKKIARVEQLLKQNKNSAAIRATKQILVKDPRNPEGHFLLGRAYLQDNKPELALMEYRTVNQIGHFGGVVKEVPFRKQMAQLFQRFNQPEEALKEFLLLLQKEPNNADLYFQTGTLFEDRKKATKAVGYYKKTLALQPGHGLAYLRLGMLYYRAKRFPEAQEYLEKAVRYQPENYEAHYFIGRMQKENKAYVEALQSFEFATRSPEFKVKSLIERGGCYLETNSVERAIPELERAVKLADEARSPDAIWAHYFLAGAYERSRKIERAIEHWEAVYRIKPGFQDVAEKMGQYQDLRQDDHIKDFVTASQTEFRNMCEHAIKAMGFSVQDISDIENGCQVIADESSTNWRNTRKQPRLIRFFRVAEMIDESRIRDLHEEMKNQNLTRCILVTSSGFSRVAMTYAESRPIDLYDKDKLLQLLSTSVS